MKEFIIGSNEAGQRFDKHLAKQLSKAPSSFIYKMLRKKNITLNGKKATGQEKLSIGDSVKIFLADETYEKFASSTLEIDKEKAATDKNLVNGAKNLDIIYEDDDIILINKPYGMLSQKAKDTDISVNELLIAYLLSTNQITNEELKTFKPSICNRLDRNTSGIIIAGKSLQGLQYASKILKDRTLGKYYLAVVKGKVEKPEVIEGYLKKDEKTNRVQISKVENGGDYINTSYEPIAIFSDISLLMVKLVTGKTHQIRAHLASTGHPIIGDPKYGDDHANKLFQDRYGIKHQLLHAYRVIFPEGNEENANSIAGNTYEAQPPKAFRMLLEEKISEEAKQKINDDINESTKRKESSDGHMEFQRLKRKYLRRAY